MIAPVYSAPIESLTPAVEDHLLMAWWKLRRSEVPAEDLAVKKDRHRGAAKMRACRYPGCDFMVDRNNRTGLCRDHLHDPTFCHCAVCMRSGRRRRYAEILLRKGYDVYAVAELTGLHRRTIQRLEATLDE